MGGRAFFTSIPKCGKNLVTALFDTLGMLRIDDPAADSASSYAMARWTLDARVAGRWLEPRRDQDGLEAWADETYASVLSLAERLRRLSTGYVHAHLAYEPTIHDAAQAAGVPVVFLYRDPRAMLASQAHFLLRLGDPDAHHFRPKITTLDAAYALLIEGDDMSLAAAEVFAAYERWLSAPGVLAVRFEDLVGARGGGSASVQLATVARIAQHIGWDGPNSALLAVAENIFNPTVGTFRRGTIDGWQDDVPASVAARYPAFFIDLPRRWGYGVDGPSESDALAEAWDSEVSADVVRTLRTELALAQADGDERLLLMQELEARIAALVAERDHLAADNGDRFRLIERLQGEVERLVAERDHLAVDNSDRLHLIERMHAEVERLVAERDHLAVDNSDRFRLIERLQGEVERLVAERDHLAGDNGDRLRLIERLQGEVERLVAERDHLAADNGDRLRLIERMHADIERLVAERDHLHDDTNARLALIRRLEATLASVTGERDRFLAENDERLALIRRLEARLAQVAAERDRLRAEGDERLKLIRQFEARIAAPLDAPAAGA